MKKRHIVLLVIAVLVLVVGVGMWSFMQRAEAGLAQLAQMSLQDPDLSAIPDGTYEGMFEVFPVKVVVQVSVAAHRIVDIKLLEHRNGQGKAAEAILPRIIQSQRVTLDAIAGATYSSKVILKAVERALSE